MRHLRFYFRHAWRDMTRNGRRTIFALFCIAAGVAAIVALRSLALMIGDSLVNNIAGSYHGDIMVEPIRSGQISTSDGRDVFAPFVLESVKTWATKHNVAMTTIISNLNIRVAPIESGSDIGRPQFAGNIFIDPKVYPFYGPVLATDPKDVPLSQLFTSPNDVVLSDNFAKNNNLKVGDQVRVSRSDQPFTVRGIVPSETESTITSQPNGPFGLLFGFVYFDHAAIAQFQTEDLPDAIYLKIPDGANVDDLNADLRSSVSGIRTWSTTMLAKNNAEISMWIDRLIVLMGLAALLIGATGIIHTMLVIVGRRTTEIAVLKTLGLKGRQITVMFLVEALIMGVLGSLMGDVLGVLFSLAARTFMQGVWPRTLVWRVYPGALETGFILGVLITAVFGFLPTLTAGLIRPAMVLRPNDTKLPAMGCAQTFFALFGVVIAIGLMAGNIIGNYIIGIIGIMLAGLSLLVVIGILWVIVTIIGKLPSFGLIDLRLALRGIGSQRLRTASTMLSLLVGIFALSVITMAATAIPKLLDFQLTNALGGNVLIIEPVSLVHGMVVNALKDQPGVKSYSQLGFYSGSLTAVNGNTNYVDNINTNLPSNVGKPINGRMVSGKDLVKRSLGTVGTADVSSPSFHPPMVAQGRALNASDAGQRNVVMTPNDIINQAGIKVGDTVTFQFGENGGGAEVTYTVVGINPPAQQGFTGQSILSALLFTAPADSFPAGVSPAIQMTVADVDSAHLNKVLLDVSSVPLVFALDVGFIDSVLKRLFEQFTAIPTVVAVLALFSGAVIIANTVSLATLERRRQVGVMKAIGLKGRRVLWQMVLENSLIGLVGGILGVGVGILGTIVFAINSPISFLQIVDWNIALILLVLSIVIALIATLLSAWTAASEKPLNVLRYE
jgi:predicted lysophospholipase L1 biosynthesis ABC-type transport system permease subunit